MRQFIIIMRIQVPGNIYNVPTITLQIVYCHLAFWISSGIILIRHTTQQIQLEYVMFNMVLNMQISSSDNKLQYFNKNIFCW